MSNLLTNIQNVCLELGLPMPNAVASSTDTTTLQMLALMNRVGIMLSTERDWNALAAEARFQTVFYTYTGTVTAGSNSITGLSSVVGLSTDFMASGAGIAADSMLTAVGSTSATMSEPAATSGTVSITFGQVRYAMPSDYARMVDKTQFNKSNRWPIFGPKDAQEWQLIKSSWLGVGSPFTRFRIMAGKFNISPMPTTVVTLGYEYISNAWALSAAGAGQTSLVADIDTSLFPGQVLILGTKLKFFEVKGFDTTALFNDFTRELEKYKGVEAASDTLSMAPPRFDQLITIANLPDTGFGI